MRLAVTAIATWLLCSGAAPAAAGTPAPAASASTQAESIDYRIAPKFAVVIGNTRYPGRYALHNAENDARLIAARLKQAGYATELLVNADRDLLYQALGHLAEHMKAGGAAAFYYAGHGMRAAGSPRCAIANGHAGRLPDHPAEGQRRTSVAGHARCLPQRPR
jgi:hypothetical protein